MVHSMAEFPKSKFKKFRLLNSAYVSVHCET